MSDTPPFGVIGGDGDDQRTIEAEASFSVREASSCSACDSCTCGGCGAS